MFFIVVIATARPGLESRLSIEKSRLELSVVVPVYQCGSCIESLCEALIPVLKGTSKSFEVILIDDGSRDNGWEQSVFQTTRYPQVKAIQLSRNFGQHFAVTAGIAEANGQHIVIMDCDLQDPPEMIPEFLKASETNDIVFSKRRVRKQSIFRKLAAATYTKLLRAVTGYQIDSESSSYTLISRQVADEFLKFNDHFRHYLYILRWLGFKSTTLEYDQAKRISGQSSYSLRMLLRHAFTGVFFQSGDFLIWIAYSGIAVATAGFGLAIYYVITYIWFTPPPGWTALAVIMLGLGGVILVSLGICGLYISKIFEEVKNRPLFVIRQRRGNA